MYAFFTKKMFCFYFVWVVYSNLFNCYKHINIKKVRLTNFYYKYVLGIKF